MSNEIKTVAEYEEGVAIFEDSKGKFLMTKDNPDLTDIEFPRCWLTTPVEHRDRLAMLT
jgi:hypothetical protein